MKKRFRQVLSLLCVLALALGCASFGALAEEQQTEVRIIAAEWADGSTQNDARPDISVSLNGESKTLTKENQWSAEVQVPAGSEEAWTYTAPEGYKIQQSTVGIMTILRVSAISVPAARTVTAYVEWEDGENAKNTRPASVQLALLADGKPCGEPVTVKAPATLASWDKLPTVREDGVTQIVYSVQQLQTPDGYTESVSGLTVTNTLQTGKLSLTAQVEGMPEDADISKLSLTVTGPDPTMPQTVAYSQMTGGAWDFGNVLPGAYLVRGTNADQLVEDYIMDVENSQVSDAVLVKAGESAALSFRYTYKLPEAYEAEEGYDPMAEIGSLSFEILGPDDRMPMTVTYSQFTDGKYELPDLAPGVYTVVERNAETLVKYYTLTSASVTGMTLDVAANGTATAKLFNQYEPAPTPEPDAEFVDIPVTKTWNDNNNADGNRPDAITVRLYADGAEVDSHVLTAGEGWRYTFVEKPRYKEDKKTEILYTVNEDPVSMYSAMINGYNITNDYMPEVTSVSVSKVWNDQNNVQKIRPESIAMSLSDGQKVVKVVVLSEANGWAATVNNLPTVVNGQAAQYAWKEQAVPGYTLEGVEQTGSHMTFTNGVWQRPEQPTQGRRPKTRGDTWYVFEDYGTPLGVNVIINHVGDCFD